MLTDIEIAQSCVMQPIEKIADTLGLTPDLLEPYGRYKAKVDYLALKDRPQKGRLVLVTAINPTPAGEGKTTVSIGLADALRLEGYNACLALREPSLGPVFGVKGGAAGGGYAQVVPMEDINLHFTGDMHAITAANNLIAAMVDNSIQQGNPCNIDPRRVTWKRCMDMNDRQLRNILDGLGGKPNGTPREDGFDITTASEIMATLCLASSIADLKARIARIVVARTYDDKPVTAGDIHAQGAATALLKDALRPNLVQTLIGTPAFVHGGPFANIAHGCNTVIATQTALRLADVVVTEAGFGADLGAEKFIDIKCRMANLVPSAVVLVARMALGDGDAYFANATALEAIAANGGCYPLDEWLDAGWLEELGLERWTYTETDEASGTENTYTAALSLDKIDALRDNGIFENRGAYLVIASNGGNIATTRETVTYMLTQLAEGNYVPAATEEPAA